MALANGCTLDEIHNSKEKPAVDGHPEHTVTVTEEPCGEKEEPSPYNDVMGHIVQPLREDAVVPKGNSSRSVLQIQPSERPTSTMIVAIVVSVVSLQSASARSYAQVSQFKQTGNTHGGLLRCE